MLSIKPFYRYLFYRKGFGIHSPFVYDLIINVIRETHDYYAYDDISMVRLQLLQNERIIQYGDKRITVKKAIKRCGLSPKEGKFLFRLTNHCKPHTVLSVGSALGLAPLCLTRYDTTVQCITLEREADVAEIAEQLLLKEKNDAHQIKTGAYPALVPESIGELQQIDCVFIGKDVGVYDWDMVFDQCLPYINDTTFFVLAGIRSSTEKKHYWTQFRQHPGVTVAIDLFNMGVLFFQPKLQKMIYKTIY